MGIYDRDYMKNRPSKKVKQKYIDLIKTHLNQIKFIIWRIIKGK